MLETAYCLFLYVDPVAVGNGTSTVVGCKLDFHSTPQVICLVMCILVVMMVAYFLDNIWVKLLRNSNEANPMKKSVLCPLNAKTDKVFFSLLTFLIALS